MKKRGISLFVALTMMLSICVPVAADDPVVQKNEIMAEYDGRYDGEKDEYTAPVKANDEVIGSVWDDQSNRGSFTTGEPIEFEICQPQNRQGENIRVDLEIPDDDLFYSTIEDDESDRKFYEVAKFCHAPLITGNIKHFPDEEQNQSHLLF